MRGRVITEVVGGEWADEWWTGVGWEAGKERGVAQLDEHAGRASDTQKACWI